MCGMDLRSLNLGSVLTVAVIWCGGCLLYAWASGWRRLAKRFAAWQPPTGQRVRVHQAQFKWGRWGEMNYRAKMHLDVYVSPEGLYLAMCAMLRLWHPPLFIPWAEIHNMENSRFFSHAMVKFEVGSPCLVTVALPKKVFENSEMGV